MTALRWLGGRLASTRHFRHILRIHHFPCSCIQRAKFCVKTEDNTNTEDQHQQKESSSKSKSSLKFIRNWIIPLGVAYASFHFYRQWRFEKSDTKYRNTYKEFFILQGVSMIQSNPKVTQFMECNQNEIEIINGQNNKWIIEGDKNYFTFEISNINRTKTAKITMTLTIYAFDDDKHLKIEVENMTVFDKFLTSDDLDKNVTSFLKQYKDPMLIESWTEHCGLELSPHEKMDVAHVNDMEKLCEEYKKEYDIDLKEDIINRMNKNGEFVRVFGKINMHSLLEIDTSVYHSSYHEVYKARVDFKVADKGNIRVENYKDPQEHKSVLKIVALTDEGHYVPVFHDIVENLD